MMKMIRCKTIKTIQSTNDLPNCSHRGYLKFIRFYLLDSLSENEVAMLRNKRINLENWILMIDQEIIEDLF